MSIKAGRPQIAFDCPRCGYHMDAATAAYAEESVQPEVGDISVCLTCAAPLEFAADGAARWLTLEEMARLEDDVRGQLVKAMVAILTFAKIDSSRPGRVRPRVRGT